MVRTLFSPLQEVSRGLGVYAKGFHWLRANLRYFFLLLIPMSLSLFTVIATWGFLMKYHEPFLNWIMYAKPEAFFALLLYYFVKATLYIVLFVMSLIFYMLVLNVLSSPIYDLVSAAVEKDLTGKPADGLSLWGTLLLMKEELKKLTFIFLVSVCVILIPGVNIVSPFITAFFIGWEYCDFPLARKGWSFRKRLNFVLRHFWSVTGFGLWLIIPGGQMILMPLAVVGGTILAVEQNREESQALSKTE